MIFFHKLAQFYLVYHFGEVVHSARAKDEGYGGLGGLFRGKGLSEDKQTIGNDTINKLHALNYEQLSRDFQAANSPMSFDEYTRFKLREIIEDYDTRIGAAIKKHQPKNKGNSIEAVNQAKKLLMDIEQFCKDMELWEKAYDENDPLCILQYQVALYVCSKLNTTDSFGAKKAALARDELAKITSNYNEMTNADRLKKIKFIKEGIRTILNENELLCAKNPQGLDLPINMSLLTFNLSPQFIPSLGTLEKMVQAALDKVEKLNTSATPSHTPSVQPSIMSSTHLALHGLGNSLVDREPTIQVFDEETINSSRLDMLEPEVSNNQTLMEAITLGNVSRVMQLFDLGFNLNMPINPRGENALECALELGKFDVVAAIKNKCPGDPAIEKSFNKACQNGLWKEAQALDKERALAEQLDQKYNGQLAWYSWNNTLVKQKCMQEAEKLIESATFDKAKFFKWMSQSKTAVYRQFKFWDVSPTNTTDYFRQKSHAMNVYSATAHHDVQQVPTL